MLGEQKKKIEINMWQFVARLSVNIMNGKELKEYF